MQSQIYKKKTIPTDSYILPIVKIFGDSNF